MPYSPTCGFGKKSLIIKDLSDLCFDDCITVSAVGNFWQICRGTMEKMYSGSGFIQAAEETNRIDQSVSVLNINKIVAKGETY